MGASGSDTLVVKSVWASFDDPPPPNLTTGNLFVTEILTGKHICFILHVLHTGRKIRDNFKNSFSFNNSFFKVETEPHIAETGLKLIMQTRIPWNIRSSCLYPSSTRITGYTTSSYASLWGSVEHVRQELYQLSYILSLRDMNFLLSKKFSCESNCLGHD